MHGDPMIAVDTPMDRIVGGMCDAVTLAARFRDRAKYWEPPYRRMAEEFYEQLFAALNGVQLAAQELPQ